MVDCDENGKNDVICICTQSISKQDWQDHQIKSNEYSLSLVDSNCPLSLKEIAKLQVLQSEKGNNLEWLESNKIPFKLIHTLRKECPTFGSMQEMMNHVENVCPYWKVKCMDLPFVNYLPRWRYTPAHMMIRNSHKDDKCLEISRREFISHSTETALDPISQKIRAIPMIFPYYCKICNQYLPSSGTHICIKEINSNDKQIYSSEILCPGCKLTIRVKSEKEIENTCESCRNNKIGVLIIPPEHQEKEIIKWKSEIKERRVKWSDHQIVCPKRRYTCSSYLSFICITESNEYSLSLVDSNCPLSLKEIAKLQVLQSEKGNNLEWLESNKIPFKLIHTLRKECPTFGSMQEMMNHVENVCPYWKVKCMDLPFVNYLPRWRYTPAHMMIRNSHKDDKCLEISRREFISHSTETALDPISQKIRAIPMIFPYYCKICNQYLPSSGTHICIKEINSNDKQIYSSEILCPGCKLTIRVKSEKEIENTCESCRNNKIGVLIIPPEHQEKEIIKWKSEIKERRVKWSVIKTLFSHKNTI
ncbi:unnamed protein product [Rhizophagus irregularis]|nr:unnamed protein product [Rhizophagus irregularis]